MDKQEFSAPSSTSGRREPLEGRHPTVHGGDVHRPAGLDRHRVLARPVWRARLWQLFQDEAYVAVLSAVTGNQAIQQVQAGLRRST